MRPVRSAAEALVFIEERGVVRFAGNGEGPSLAEAIAGEPIHGSWWGHPSGKRIFQISSELDDSEDVLFCRLIAGKVTLAHRRVWPAIARLAKELPVERIARVRQEHTESGAHRKIEEPFPRWAPREVLAAAARLTLADARAMLPAEALTTTTKRARSARPRRTRGDAGGGADG
jgi:hypothetical protein